jgi:CMP-N,N'-diacetyllegionaminic acid synthase
LTFAEKITVIIPARGGSKGLPNKNMLVLGDQILVDYSIEFAKRFADEIVVSTDIPELLDRHDKKINYLRRRPDLAEDNTPIEDVILDIISGAELKNETVCLLQPTSPFRTLAEVSAMVDMYSKNRHTTLSVYRCQSTILKSFIEVDGVVKTINEAKYLSANRQQLPNVFRPNGSIYLFSKTSFLESGRFDFENVNIFESESSIDIDTIDDLKKAESYLATLDENVLQACLKG